MFYRIRSQSDAGIRPSALTYFAAGLGILVIRMGYEISYCRTCQSQVRGADLEKGLAVRIDGHAYCPACAKALPKPSPVVTPPSFRRPPRGKMSSDRIPIPNLTTPNRAMATRPAARSPVPLILAVLAAGIGLIILLALAFSGGSPHPPPAPAPTPVPAPAPGPTPRGAAIPRPVPIPGGSSGVDVLADLEKAFADGVDPTDVLLRCDQARKQLAGTPEAARLVAFEERVLQLKRDTERDRQVNGVLAVLRKMREEDPRFRRRSDAVALLESTKAIAGPRLGEIERALADYIRDAEIYRTEMTGLAAWYTFDAADGLAKDQSTFQRHGTASAAWIAEDGPRKGVLRIKSHNELVLPVPVREDFTIAFWMKTQQLAPIEDQWWKGVGVVDAECNGIVADFGVGLLGTHVAFGIGGPPDTTIASKTEVVDGRWRHIGATYRMSEGLFRLYVDGALEAEGRGKAEPRSIPERIVVGHIQTGGGHFEGSLDDLRFYSRVLSDAELRTIASR
jgi:hypothetical protein